MQPKVRLLTLLVLIQTASTLFASAERDTLKVYPFDPVVVTGTRIETPSRELPISISVIDQKMIEEQNHVPLLDLVSENVPGLFVTRRTNIGYGVASGAAGQISLRGLGASPNTQVLVLIDGRPDLMGLFGHPLGDAYFLHDVEKIEIVRGPASLLYGSNAMGGAINIVTKHQHARGFHLSVPIRYSNFDTKQALLGQSYQAQRWGYSLSYGYRNSDGLRQDANDSYNSNSANVEFHASLTNAIDVLFNSYLTNLELYDPGRIEEAFTDHIYDLKRRGGDITLRHKSQSLLGDLKVHHNFGVHKIYDGYESEDYSTGIVLTENYLPAENTRVTMGIDLRRYGGKARISDFWNTQNVQELSGLISLHQKFLERIVLDGGLRYMHHSVAGDEWIPAAGLVLLLPREWNLKVQYAKGYRNPTINELYLFMPSTTDLQPEISRNVELTVGKKFATLLSSSVTVFHTKAENLIQKMGFPPLYRNTGEVTLSGVEWEYQLLLPPYLAIHGSASATSFSQPVAGSPGEKVDVSIRYNPVKILFVTLQGQWIYNLWSVENPYAYTAPVYLRLDPYILVHLRANYTVHRYLQLYCSVENLADVSYATMYHFPMPGRTFTLGVTASY